MTRQYKTRRAKTVIYSNLTQEEIKKHRREYMRGYMRNKARNYTTQERKIINNRSKLWREKNPNYINIYLMENKEFINYKRRTQKIKCELCQCMISQSNKATHYRTAKHINNYNRSINRIY